MLKNTIQIKLNEIFTKDEEKIIIITKTEYVLYKNNGHPFNMIENRTSK